MTDVKKPTRAEQPQEPMKKAGEKMTEVTEKGGKGGTSTMMGAAAGAVAGATIGGLAGAALADEKTRKNVTESLTNIAKTAGETVKRLDENQGKIKKTLRDAPTSLKQTADTVKDKAADTQITHTKKS